MLCKICGIKVPEWADLCYKHRLKAPLKNKKKSRKQRRKEKTVEKLAKSANKKYQKWGIAVLKRDGYQIVRCG